MLQTEDVRAAGSVALSDAPARNADGPFSRDIPQETKERPVPRAQVEHVAAEKRDAPGKNRARRPLVLSFAALLLASVAGSGYIYRDDSSHFESTDDAFIAARQFAIAPKVSGYIAAVPVTDNQHVEAGQVIARIDDSDYRTALAQAEAQVDAAQASIANIDAQITVQQAQVAESLS